MKKIILALLILVLPDVYAKPPKPLLWRVSDGDNSVYLLGSFHLLKADDYPLDAAVGKALEDAEKIYFEISPEEMNNPDIARKMFQLGQIGNGKTLQQSLGNEVWNKLKSYCETNNLPLAQFQHFKPWLAGLMISFAEMRRAGLREEFGLDRHFVNRAQKNHKEIDAFESAADQFALFDRLNAEEQNQFLQETLKEAENPGYIDELHRYWRTGDAQGMWQMTAEKMQKDAPEFYRRFVVDRNDAWLPRLIEFLQENRRDNALVVVGSLHLLGEDGLVNRLQQLGYRVDRLP